MADTIVRVAEDGSTVVLDGVDQLREIMAVAAANVAADLQPIVEDAENSAEAAAASAASAAATLARAIKAPGGETIGDLPAAADRATKYLAFGAGGEPVAAAGTDGGADGTLRTDLASGAAGSALILHKIAGAGTFARSLRQWAAMGGFRDDSILNWIDSNDDPAILAGTTPNNYSAAGQAALDGNLRSLWLPPGLFNISGLRARTGSRIVGSGTGKTFIKALAAQAPNNPIIRNYLANPANDAARDADITIAHLTLDGNKANNASQIEWGMCIQMFAAQRVWIDHVRTVNPQGDGVYLGPSYAVDGGTSYPAVACEDVWLNVITEDFYRQGVAIVSAIGVRGFVLARNGRLFGLDLETNDSAGKVKDVDLSLTAIGCGLSGNNSTGGLGVTSDGTGGGTLEDIAVRLNIRDCFGCGAVWRDAKGLRLSGTILRQEVHGLLGNAGGAGPSRVALDVLVDDPGGLGLSVVETVGSTYDGLLRVRHAGKSGAVASSVSIRNARGGTLTIESEAGTYTDQGVALYDTNDMNLNVSCTGPHRSHNLWLRGTSSGNRVNSFRASGSTFGWAVMEEAGCDNNRVSNASLSGAYGGGLISLSGANSMVDPSATTGITAFAGGGKTNATRLRAKFNVVATVAAASDSVLLPAARRGDTITVRNQGANAMQVFGQGSDTINGVATGTGVPQAAGTTVTYRAGADGQWFT